MDILYKYRYSDDSNVIRPKRILSKIINFDRVGRLIL